MGLFICQGCGHENSAWTGQCANCGTSESIRLATNVDRMVDRVVDGRYRIIRKLGQGGMGAVYLAEQIGIGHKVALKFLRADLSEDPDIARRFLNEAKSYALVAHPNAVALHDFRQDAEGNLFIAMEYCEGTDLKKLLAEKGRLPLPEAADIILQVAEVLSHAHSRGVVHRDLKPENVIVRKGLHGVHVKVLDFGIARLMGDQTKLTLAGSIAGTPRYMAPEQVEGKEIDHRVDIYALGILLFEILTGVQPFDGQTVAEILRNQVVKPMPRLGQIAAELDYPELDAVVQKATAKRPDERFADMSSFAHALVQALPTQAKGTAGIVGGDTWVRPDTGRSLVDRPGPPVAGETVKARRSRGPVLAAIVALAVVAAGAGMVALRASRSEAPESELRPERIEATAPANPKPPVDALVQPGTVRVEMLERSKVNLLQANTQFGAGDLEGASLFLKDVAPGTPEHAEAQALAEKIREIREALETANAHFRRGECEAAAPLYEKVLELNPRIADAARGKAACERSRLPSTVE